MAKQKHWKDRNLSDAELRKMVWNAGFPVVQAPFAQAVNAYRGRDIWDLDQFKRDVRAYLLGDEKWPADVVDTCMVAYDDKLRRFMYRGLEMSEIATLMKEKK